MELMNRIDRILPLNLIFYFISTKEIMHMLRFVLLLFNLNL